MKHSIHLLMCFSVHLFFGFIQMASFTATAQMVDMKEVSKALEKVLKQKIDELSKNDFDMVIFRLHPDGFNADVIINSKTTSFSRYNRAVDIRHQKPSYIFPPPDSVKNDFKDSLMIYYFPPGGHSLISMRDLRPDITVVGDTFIYRTSDKKLSDGRYGISTTIPTGHNQFSYAWFLPDNFEPLYYQCNRNGKWEKRDNMLHFVAEKNQNNLIFEIAYKRTTKIPGEINGRKINYTKTINITSPNITIKTSDPQRPDGDIVSLNLNGEWILKGFEVTERPLALKVAAPNTQNYLILYAENEGAIPPNTAAIEIWDGTTTQKITLNAAKGYCEAISILLKQ